MEGKHSNAGVASVRCKASIADDLSCRRGIALMPTGQFQAGQIRRRMLINIGEETIMQRHHLQRETARSEEHTSELQSLMRNSYAVFCLKKTIYNLQSVIASITPKLTLSDIPD